MKMNENLTVNEKFRKKMIKQLVESFAPDCVVVASGITCKMSCRNYTYSFSSPWRSDSGNTRYFDFFSIIGEERNMPHNLNKFGCYAEFWRIATIASLPGIDILEFSPRTNEVSAGVNFDDYMQWAENAIKVIDLDYKDYKDFEEIAFRFGALKQSDKTLKERRKEFADIITENVQTITNTQSAYSTKSQSGKRKYNMKEPKSNLEILKYVVSATKSKIAKPEFKEKVKEFGTGLMAREQIHNKICEEVKKIVNEKGFNYTDEQIDRLVWKSFSIVDSKNEEYSMIKSVANKEPMQLFIEIFY